MKKYVWGRVVRAILSAFIVTVIAMVMIYTLIPRHLIFKTDPTYQKLGGKADDRERYKNTAYERLGYIYFDEQVDMCKAYAADSVEACNVNGSSQAKEVAEKYEADGWTVKQYKAGGYYAYKDVPIFKIVANFFSNLIEIDHPWRVNDSSNPDLKRRIYFGTDYNGVPALMGEGTKHKYLIYFNGSFPFIHQNVISLNLGKSYPSYAYTDISKVISSGQGTEKSTMQKFETGSKTKSAVIQHSCTYKATKNLDKLDKNKFTDNYATCDTTKKDPSMIATSMTFGVLALLLAYCIAIPAGMLMASHKGKAADHIGTVWINFMIAVPSLAFIFFGRQVFYLLGFPTSFPSLGAHNIKSYIPAIVILALMNTGSLMLWTRRYMLDQSNADYVKFARAKGLSQSEIFKKHILRNAVIPIVHDLPASIILTITGAVLTETVFAIPGTGKLLPDAINEHNNAMIVALTILYTSLSIFSVLIGDLLMTVVDPRIKLTDDGGAN